MDDETLKEFQELFDFDIAKKDVILKKIITNDIITGKKQIFLLMFIKIQI